MLGEHVAINGALNELKYLDVLHQHIGVVTYWRVTGPSTDECSAHNNVMV